MRIPPASNAHRSRRLVNKVKKSERSKVGEAVRQRDRAWKHEEDMYDQREDLRDMLKRVVDAYYGASFGVSTCELAAAMKDACELLHNGDSSDG